MDMDPGVLMSLLNDDKGFMGSEFIWIILFFFLFGFGGNGFGKGGAAGEMVDIQAAVKAANCDQNMTSMLFSAVEGNGAAIQGLSQYLGVQSDQIQGAIRQVGQGICDLGYKTGMDSRDILQAIGTGNCALQAELAQCCCTTNRNIDSLRYDMEKCCCETQTAIREGFCSLNNNLTSQITQLNYNQQQGFQSIINHMNAQETDRLRTELQSAQWQISQQAQTATLEDFIRKQMCIPCPINPLTK